MDEFAIIKKKHIEGLTADQVARAEACDSPEELLELAKSEGVELTDEQLEAVAGGTWEELWHSCPYCFGPITDIGNGLFKCRKCGRICRRPE